MQYDLNQPWKTLDKWQKEYINTDPAQNCFLLTTRQGGKTTAMSIKAVELCVNKFKKGEFVLISSLTERQAQLMLAKALVYAQAKYKSKIKRGKDKPTMHRIMFENGTGILCYAAGQEGDSTRGYTLKKLLVDEGARMGEAYFNSAIPTLSVSGGSMDISSTPNGKKHKDGSEKFFFKCSKDDDYKKFYVSAYDCPRHSEEFLEKEKKRMSKMQFAQEYLAKFLDEIRQVISDELIKKICCMKRRPAFIRKNTYYGGSDIAGLGGDEITYVILDKISKDKIVQVENIVEKRNYTTETSDKIISLNDLYNFKAYGIDDGGVGFGVYSELLRNEKMKRKVFALNNASRDVDYKGEKSKKLLKTDMYLNLLAWAENGRIKLLDDDEIKLSLQSIQFDDEGNIFSNYGHIAEGLIRALWLATKDKSLNIFVHTF